MKKWKHRAAPRKRISSINFGVSYLHKRYSNQKKLEYKARTGRLRGKQLDSGFYVDQTYGALNKAWLAYTISCKNDDWEKRSYYGAVIQKLERELGLKIYDFPEIQDLAADFLNDRKDDPNIQDMSVEEIEEIMMKSDSAFWDRVRGRARF